MDSNKKKVVIGIQSRLRSSRLPAKALLKIDDCSIIGFTIKRALSSNLPVYVLTSDERPDDLIEKESEKYLPDGVIRGSHENVLERFVKLQKETQADILVRVTGDNPFTDFRLIPLLLSYLSENNLHYATVDKRFSLEGTNLELFTKEILKLSYEKDASFTNKDNVTTFMKKDDKAGNLQTLLQTKHMTKKSIVDYSVTVDTINDYIKINQLLMEIKKYISNVSEKDFLDISLNLINRENSNFPQGRNHPI